METDLEERSSEAKAKKHSSNELVIDLPETMAPSAASSKAPERSRESREKPANEANKENLRTIEVSLSGGSIEQRLVDLPDLRSSGSRPTNFVERTKCYSEDTDCEFDAYSSDSEFEDDGRCSKCSLENRLENRIENRMENRMEKRLEKFENRQESRPESGYLPTSKSLLNYLDTNNNKTGKPFASKEFNFNANTSSTTRFHVQSSQFESSQFPSGQFQSGHKSATIVMPRLKTEI